MSRLAHGEQNVGAALQRRDELGELARAFNVLPQYRFAGAHHALLEKTSQMEVDRIERQGLEEALLQPENEGCRATDGRSGA